MLTSPSMRSHYADPFALTYSKEHSLCLVSPLLPATSLSSPPLFSPLSSRLPPVSTSPHNSFTQPLYSRLTPNSTGVRRGKGGKINTSLPRERLALVGRA
ncbi:unnamed protein product [Cutaneotrichosporon oleaginosum]